ncbi:hypothetical protein ACVJGC_002428 [Bradyrhizobium diazoefficiens]
MLAEEVTGAVSAMAADTTPQATAAAFPGGSGSLHRGGTYVNSNTGNRYGTHQ